VNSQARASDRASGRSDVAHEVDGSRDSDQRPAPRPSGARPGVDGMGRDAQRARRKRAEELNDLLIDRHAV
jgi:hypothetical protein